MILFWVYIMRYGYLQGSLFYVFVICWHFPPPGWSWLADSMLLFNISDPWPLLPSGWCDELAVVQAQYGDVADTRGVGENKNLRTGKYECFTAMS